MKGKYRHVSSILSLKRAYTNSPHLHTTLTFLTQPTSLFGDASDTCCGFGN